jgi:hypothetical protein
MSGGVENGDLNARGAVVVFEVLDDHGERHGRASIWSDGGMIRRVWRGGRPGRKPRRQFEI